MALSEVQAFEKFKKGEEIAFRFFYDKHVGLVQYVGFTFGLGPSEKDDLVQEVFLKLFNNRAQLASPGQMAAWLAMTARNHLIDGKRKASVAKAHAEGEKQDPDFGQMPVRPDGVLVTRLLQDVLVELRGETGYQDFCDFYLTGLTNQEIADRNREAIGTVTSRLVRMRKKFRELFENRYGKGYP